MERKLVFVYCLLLLLLAAVLFFAFGGDWIQNNHELKFFAFGIMCSVAGAIGGVLVSCIVNLLYGDLKTVLKVERQGELRNRRDSNRRIIIDQLEYSYRIIFSKTDAPVDTRKIIYDQQWFVRLEDAGLTPEERRETAIWMQKIMQLADGIYVHREEKTKRFPEGFSYVVDGSNLSLTDAENIFGDQQPKMADILSKYR
jgi:hypothetical protein